MRRTSLLLALVLLVAVVPANASHSMKRVSSTSITEAGGLGRVEIRKNLAAILQKDEGIVALVNLKDPRDPKVLGRYDDGAAQSLDGDVAFSADGRFVIYARQTVQFSRDGIHVIDITDPGSPTLRSYSPGGGAYRILTHRHEAGEYVVLLDAVLGLVVYRMVEGVLAPVYLDPLPALKVGGPASAGMEIVDGRLYVTTGETGLQVYDFQDPMSPSLLGSWSDEGLAEVEVVKNGKKVLVYGATEYWFDPTNENEILVLDATDPAGIRELDRWSHVSSTDAGLRLQGLVWQDGILYAAHSEAGVVGFRGGRVVERLASDSDCTHLRPGEACLDVLDGPNAFDVESLGDALVVTDTAGRLVIARR